MKATAIYSTLLSCCPFLLGHKARRTLGKVFWDVCFSDISLVFWVILALSHSLPCYQEESGSPKQLNKFYFPNNLCPLPAFLILPWCLQWCFFDLFFPCCFSHTYSYSVTVPATSAFCFFSLPLLFLSKHESQKPKAAKQRSDQRVPSLERTGGERPGRLQGRQREAKTRGV